MFILFWLAPDFGGQYLDTGPNFSNIGTFAVPLSTYVLMDTQIKWVPRTISDKDDVRSLGYILKYIKVEKLLLSQNASKLG